MPNHPVNTDALIASLESAFSSAVGRSSELANLVQFLSERDAKAAVFGGWPRDLILSYMTRTPLAPSDIDVVVNGVSREELRRALPDTAQLNAFGGFSVPCTPLKIDAWCIEDTHTLKIRNGPFHLELLPTTTVFTICSITYHPSALGQNASIHENRFFESLESRTIEFQGGEIRYPEQQVGRALRYATRFKLAFGADVDRFVRSHMLTEDARERIRSGLIQHTPRPLLKRTLEMFETLDPASDR